MVRFHPGSLNNKWSVGVSAARRRGKAEDRVQFPNGPLTEAADRSGRIKAEGERGNENVRGAGPTGRHLACTQVIGVRFPGAPLRQVREQIIPESRRNIRSMTLSD